MIRAELAFVVGIQGFAKLRHGNDISTRTTLKKKSRQTGNEVQDSLAEAEVQADPAISSSSPSSSISSSVLLESALLERCGANKAGFPETVLMPERFDSWTVLAKPAVLERGGYRGNHLRKRIVLPLPLSFKTPK